MPSDAVGRWIGTATEPRICKPSVGAGAAGVAVDAGGAMRRGANGTGTT
jgi:hypothetical protein